MPLGLGKAPATLQLLMDGIFCEQIRKDLAAYCEDLLMYALRHAEMLHILDRTMGQLIDAGFNYKLQKSPVFPDSIRYLGHIRNVGKIAADQSKLDKISEWPFPKTGNEMASFRGLRN